MRVLVCSGRIGAAPPASAGTALGRAFALAGPDVQVAVVPLAPGGADLVSSLESLEWRGDVVGAGDPVEVGRLLAQALSGAPGPLLVDLTTFADAPPESAAEVLTGLGVGLDAPGPRLAELRRLAQRRDLVAIVPAHEAAQRLVGVEGLAARRGYQAGRGVADVLAEDARLADLASMLGVGDRAGLGAAGGAPLAILALGGRVSTGVGVCREAADLDRTLGVADLLVVGTDTFTIGDFGGPVVQGVAPLAAEAAVPCLAVAREVDISLRELRRHGVEAAQRLGGGPEATPSELERRARSIAQSWVW